MVQVAAIAISGGMRLNELAVSLSFRTYALLTVASTSGSSARPAALLRLRTTQTKKRVK
jgi:hypothetical protein